MKRTITIPKEEYELYEQVLDDEQKLDDYSFNEEIASFYAHFPNDFEIRLDVVNDQPPFIKTTLAKNRKVIMRKKSFLLIPESIKFEVEDQLFEIDILQY